MGTCNSCCDSYLCVEWKGHRSHSSPQPKKIFEYGSKSGRLMVWLAKGQFAVTHIGGVKDSEGMLLKSHSNINNRFAQFYQNLYFSGMDYSHQELSKYLVGVPLLTLGNGVCKDLETDITLEEVQIALSQLQAGKIPRADGLPTEFYSHHQDILAPRLVSVYAQFFKLEELPESMSEAVVVLIPKPGKDPEDCSSYRPISLLKVDAKILVKILANRLSAVLEEVVHPDQTGFMPVKGTDINLHRLFLNMSVTHKNSGKQVIASLDAEKAFDSVKWVFLWEVWIWS